MKTSVWTIEKEFAFEAAHRLPKHDGKCQRLHGHSFRGVVGIVATSLVKLGPKTGMVVDYGDIKSVLTPLIEKRLDHFYLNESIPELENPTSEELARWIYKQLLPFLNVAYVRVFETCTSSATYEERGHSVLDAFGGE